MTELCISKFSPLLQWCKHIEVSYFLQCCRIYSRNGQHDNAVTSPYETFIVFIKHSYRSTLKLFATRLDDSVTNIVTTLQKLRHNSDPQHNIQN